MATTNTNVSSKIKVINTSRSDLSRRFQLNGLQVRADALEKLSQELKHGSPPYESIDDFISQLCEIMLTQMSIDSTIINSDLAQQAIEILREHRRLNGSTSTESSSELIVIKNVEVKSAFSATNSKPASSQFSRQYNQLVAALKKLPAFESGQYRLTSIDELNTYDSSIEFKCILFAMIRKDPSRIMEFLLEDPTGKVPVTFHREHTTYREWATFENGIYLAEGSYDAHRDSFLAQSIGLIPPISSMLPSPDQPLAMAKDSMVIILADIHLDNPKTIEALKFLFTGYSQVDQVPEVFVLMGNFTSEPVDHFDLKDHMKSLVKLISCFKRLANQSRFVFVPGPNDLIAEPAGAHSQDTHESIVVNHFSSEHFPTTTTKLKHYYLATNPFHLQIQGRNLCLYGSPMVQHAAKNVIESSVVNLQQQSNRAALVNSRNVDSFLGSLGRMMVSTAHLQAGISRSYINSLSLFPQIPDLILCADAQFGQCQQVPLYDGVVQFGTLGSFSCGGGQFVCYYADTNTLEESQVSV